MTNGNYIPTVTGTAGSSVTHEIVGADRQTIAVIDLMKQLQAAHRLCFHCLNRHYPNIEFTIKDLPYNCRDGLLPINTDGNDCQYFKQGKFTYIREKLM